MERINLLADLFHFVVDHLWVSAFSDFRKGDSRTETIVGRFGGKPVGGMAYIDQLETTATQYLARVDAAQAKGQHGEEKVDVVDKGDDHHENGDNEQGHRRGFVAWQKLL